MRKSFLIFELILVIILLSFLYSVFVPKNNIDKSQELKNKLIMYISYLRYQALIDDKYSNDDLWHKRRWTIKFFRCQKNLQRGIYFSIYSDFNDTGHANQKESLKDPLTGKYIYSSNFCNDNNKNSKYVLITKHYGISNIDISCNLTTSLGQLSFGSNGKVYSRLSNFKNEEYKYEIEQPCYIRLISNNKNEPKKEIKIYHKTGFVE